MKREDLRVTKLPNGVVVASIENNSPITRVSAIVNVGARHEKHDTLGAAHVIRAASNLVRLLLYCTYDHGLDTSVLLSVLG